MTGLTVPDCPQCRSGVIAWVGDAPQYGEDTWHR